MDKKTFIETTRKLIQAGCFTGRHSELDGSMAIFCDALEQDINITRQLSTSVSNWAESSKSTSNNMTVDEAWDFLYIGIGDLGTNYKVNHREWFQKEFDAHPEAYSQEVQNLWLTVFSVTPWPDLNSRFKKLKSFLDNQVKTFAPLVAQAIRNKTHPFNQLYQANYFENLDGFLHEKSWDKAATLMPEIERSRTFFKTMREETKTKLFTQTDVFFTLEQGTHCHLIPAPEFQTWFASLERKESIKLEGSYLLYKINANNLVIANGPGTPGARLIKNGELFTLCNNTVADKMANAEAKKRNPEDSDALKTRLRTEHLLEIVNALPLIIQQSNAIEKSICILQ